MKKSTFKAFTLVEMLIVIVIIGILIASLMPRMQTAQGRARDVARKNDLSQIQTAIITSQSDRKVWPGMDGAKSGVTVGTIAQDLKDAWMSSVPTDPNGSNDNYWIGSNFLATMGSDADKLWQYLYMVGKRNWVTDAWFVLMAKTEVEWSSNWVVCASPTKDKKLESNEWYIINTDDLSSLKLCTTVKKVDTTHTACAIDTATNTCYYKDTWELRYILVY